MGIISRCKFVDRLFDNVYGYIGITQTEKHIIENPAFQRLHHIRQLGLASSIFPTGVHTRFSHSLGVLYVMDKMVSHLRDQGLNIDRHEHETLRLAALLHDIGHLPFSHSGEGATAAFEESKKISKDIELSTTGTTPSRRPDEIKRSSKLHEDISRIVVQHWEDVYTTLAMSEYDPLEIGNIIVGGSGSTHQTLLLHSELDADRLDYLVRDSKNLGVVYGNVELDHIVSTIGFSCADNGEIIIGGTEKGLHAIEHYLISRYLMYSQIIFNPKIYCLEQLLKKIYLYMIALPFDHVCHLPTKDEIIRMIISNDKHGFYNFNDHYAYFKMRELHDILDKKETGCSASQEEKDVNAAIKVLFSGNIPKPIIICRDLIGQNDKINSAIPSFNKHVEDNIERTCRELNLNPGAIFYGIEYVKPTKLSRDTKVGKLPGQFDAEEALKLIKDDLSVDYAVNNDATILKHINDKQLQLIYIFANPVLLDKQRVSREVVTQALRRNIDINLRPGS